MDVAARARVRCAWAKFKELSPILTARGASYHMKGKIFKACVQSVLTCGTETWAMKTENLHNLERTECMMVSDGCVVMPGSHYSDFSARNRRFLGEKSARNQHGSHYNDFSAISRQEIADFSPRYRRENK